MVNKSSIINKIIQSQDKITQFGVIKIGIFGSYVREEQNNKSDLDILVQFDKNQKSYDNFYDLSEFLENLLNLKIDLVTTDSLSPFIGPEILKEVQFLEIAA